MASVLLVIDDIGLAMPLQEGLEGGGFEVSWQQGVEGTPSSSADAVLLGADHGEFESRVGQFRAIETVPAVVAVGSTDTAAATANRLRVPFVPANATPAELCRAVGRSLAHRFAGGLSIGHACGALGVQAIGSREDQILQVVRGSREVDIALVQAALHWYPKHYVCMTDFAPRLREARVMQVPEIELLALCDGSKTLQTLVRSGKLSPGRSAAMIWVLACVGAVQFSKEPPGGRSRARRAVIMARRHLIARRNRLDSSTYYDVLELSPSCEIEDIERSVHLLARRYSPEALANLDLADIASFAEPLWQQILKARKTLSDWATRGRYNDWLEEHIDEVNTMWARDQGNLEAAEEHYGRGQEALVAGDPHAAVAQFAAAARACPDRPDFECSLAWAQFRAAIARGKDRAETASELRARAEEYNDGHRPWPRALVALALLCAADGDSSSARWHVREALSIDPNLPAARQLWSKLGGDAG